MKLNSFEQFVKYCLVGVINTLIDFAIYFSLTRETLIFSNHLSSAKALSFVGATTFSFFANRFFTFNRRHSPSLLEAVRFYSTVGSGIFINVGLHYLIIRNGLSDVIALMVATFGTLIWGFLFSKFWVFKE